MVDSPFARSAPEIASGPATTAWRAAEAAFAPSTPELVSPPIVVIKRKRLSQDVQAECQEPEQPGEFLEGMSVRPARVFRLAPSASTRLPDRDDAASAVVAIGEGVPVRVRPLRRRRALHSEVVITRPCAIDAAESSLEDGQRGNGDPAVVSVGRPANDEAAFGHPNYFSGARMRQLIAEIAVLQHQADALKKREAVKSVRWIKAAISAYDLTASELGL